MTRVVSPSSRLSATLIAAFVALVSTLAVAATAQARPFKTGVFDTGAYLGGDNSIAYKRTAAAGGTYVKSFVYWDTIAPGDRPTNWSPRDPSEPRYEFRALDDMVKRAAAAHVQPIVAILGTPSWAHESSSCTAGNACAPKLSDLADFTRAMAARYSGTFQGLPAIRYWQAWSEPNLNFFLQPNSPVLYRTMVDTMTQEIKAADPKAKVIAGGLAPLGNDSAVAPLKFMREMLCMKGRTAPKPTCPAKSNFDIWGTNPYTTGNAFHDAIHTDDVSLGDLPLMGTLLRAADKANHIKSRFKTVPFWVTEFSWDTKPPDSHGVPVLRHQRWVAEAFHTMYEAGVSVGIWFLLEDQANLGRTDHETYQSGLYFHAPTIAKEKPKPALAAFAFPFTALETKAGVEIWGRTPKGKSGKVTIQYRGGKGYKTVATLPARGSGVFQKVLHTSANSGTFRAIFRGKMAPDFKLMTDKDYYQPPFGRPLLGRHG